MLVLGCMSLSFLGVAEQARERIGVPVINPAMCALKTAEALVAQALMPSRRTYARPRKDIFDGWKENAMKTRNRRAKQFLQTAVGVGGVAGAAWRRAGARRVAGVAEAPPLDVVIADGRVIDGTGRAAFEAAVGMRGGVIADIGVIPDSAARQVIDARGQFVCPGFIDPHAHEEILMVADPVLEKFVRQGVTTLVNGNCGHSVTPYRAKTVLEYWYREALISKKRSLMKVDWEGVDGYAKVDRRHRRHHQQRRAARLRRHPLGRDARRPRSAADRRRVEGDRAARRDAASSRAPSACPPGSPIGRASTPRPTS